MAGARAGRGRVYRPTKDAAELAAERMGAALDAGRDRGAVLQRFVTALSADDEAALRRMLAEGRGPGCGASATDRNDAVPVMFSAALVATEDSRFYTHHGVDLVGIGRVGLALVESSGDPGGSTLDQQLAKTLYPGQGVSGKAVQVVLAVKLDATWSKPQILEMYAQSVYLGHGADTCSRVPAAISPQPVSQRGYPGCVADMVVLSCPPPLDSVSLSTLRS